MRGLYTSKIMLILTAFYVNDICQLRVLTISIRIAPTLNILLGVFFAALPKISDENPLYIKPAIINYR